ncbi:hypothetical protein GN316_11915 [Xylophilus sp. Kf1]|nr:hypothetical protein [Xylophilus sp. Kf1]
MIAKYARIRDYKGVGVDPHLTLGKHYIVLGLTFKSNSVEYPSQIHILSDSEPFPSLWDLRHFDIVDPRLPDNWVLREFENFRAVGGCHELCPAAFVGAFWDLFHDGDSLAENKFQQVLSQLRLFHGFA